MASSRQRDPELVTPAEAAYVVGVGRRVFRAEVLPELAIQRRGLQTLVPVWELERWLAGGLGGSPQLKRRLQEAEAPPSVLPAVWTSWPGQSGANGHSLTPPWPTRRPWRGGEE
jgi:hypothetical protein